MAQLERPRLKTGVVWRDIHLKQNRPSCQIIAKLTVAGRVRHPETPPLMRLYGITN